MMDEMIDKGRGALVGGAVGDALGYVVEFSSLGAIRKRFGADGIAEYVLDREGVAEFSDDTQMSLFTAEGLLNAVAEGKSGAVEILPFIANAYEYWYYTQSRRPSKMEGDWLSHIKALWEGRAPGMTCLSALEALATPGGRVSNNSKGCGGVMRVAPIGIFSAAHPALLDVAETCRLAGGAAEVTHQHPLSTYSSMALAMIVAECIVHETVDRETFREIVLNRVFGTLHECFRDDRHLATLQTLVEKSLKLALSSRTDTDAIFILGEGWVAEETLAIATFSVMRYVDDFEKCIRCAVNHSGDSDSTGAVAGNIIGAILGYRAIPQKYLDNLELRDLLLTVADDLCGASSAEQMTERYTLHRPLNVAPSHLL